jgi:predicted transcriptional regulator YdeE
MKFKYANEMSDFEIAQHTWEVFQRDYPYDSIVLLRDFTEETLKTSFNMSSSKAKRYANEVYKLYFGS